MTLDTVALIILVVITLLLIYGIVGVYGVPYAIAKRRNHPHREAIGAATWLSLFTLGVLWPFLWIWALLYRPDTGWGFGTSSASSTASLDALEQRVARLESERG
ncbi:DUF3302 domain-containing protein [Acuticoccus sp. M5D2P5]|uniref:DUF3302 domain-containing protein n=1 Tax=Acuticoccus kalidii TaxID=2910977 RepID=UPI001F345E41|nr:DUF3302 domain-containing protein [Acuticoccus kalidii]MCF3934815.1 DUF3302 domain-containing protein [Acuticoccus kalidii]